MYVLLSLQVDCVEMVCPIATELKQLETNGVVAYDAFLKQEVMVIALVICITADNPRASELLNHLGPTSRMFCRICMVTKAIFFSIRSSILYHVNHVDKKGDPASVGELRSKSKMLAQIALIQSQRTATDRNAMRTRYGMKESSNSLLELPVDLHRYLYIEPATSMCFL